MVKIVGHRGAKGLELENTMPGFVRAKEIGVDAIEFDVQLTKDNQFVVIHDSRLHRVSDSEASVGDLTYEALRKIPLRNGTPVPLLRDVLTFLGSTPVVIDLKMRHGLREFFEVLDEFPRINVTIVTKWQDNVSECKRLRPTIPTFAGQRFYMPVGPLKRVRRLGADGINLYFIWLNPFTYRAAQRYGMQIQVYTVNNLVIARILSRLYPNIWICTNYPDRFMEYLKSTRDSA